MAKCKGCGEDHSFINDSYEGLQEWRDCLQRRLAQRDARIAELEKEVNYLRAHHDQCHQPAANYELLLARLKGEATDHGDCPVAKKLDDLEAAGQRWVDAMDSWLETGVPQDAETSKSIYDQMKAALKK